MSTVTQPSCLATQTFKGVLLIDEVNDLYATDTHYVVCLGVLVMTFDKVKRLVSTYAMIKSPQVLKAVDECLSGKQSFHKTFGFSSTPFYSNDLVSYHGSMDLSVDFIFKRGLQELSPDVFPAIYKEQQLLLRSSSTSTEEDNIKSKTSRNRHRTDWCIRLGAFHDVCFSAQHPGESTFNVKVLLRSGPSDRGTDDGFDLILNLDKIDSLVAYVQPNWDVYCDTKNLNLSRYRSLGVLEDRIRPFRSQR